MIKIKVFSLLALLVIIPALIFTGCNKRDEITSPNNIDFNSPEFALIDYTDVTNSLDDASLDSPMAFNSTIINYSFLSMADFRVGNAALMNTLSGGRWMQLFDWGKQLGLVFRGMNLTDDQKVAIKDLLTTYHDSFKGLVKAFADANQSIIDDTNAKRQAIVEAVKAGKMTRAEAAPKIKALNDDTRAAIDSNPASKRIKNQMCTLRSNLISAIGAKLTDDQLTKWRVLLSLLKDPCQ